jgi:holliday junction DNA helicase RuvB
MKFLGLFQKTKQDFTNIEGLDDVKNIIRRALDCEDSYNLLLIGPPGSAKTLFLMEIERSRSDAIYFDASNTTNRILQVLEEEQPEIICLDELDKLPKNFQGQLLNLMETGHVKVDQKNHSCDFILEGFKIFATANDITKLSKPVQSRFRRLYLPRYTKEQFLDVAVKVCPKLNEDIATMIGEQVWTQHGDIRDVISVSKLVQKNDSLEDIGEIISTFSKYSRIQGGDLPNERQKN